MSGSWKIMGVLTDSLGIFHGRYNGRYQISMELMGFDHQLNGNIMGT
jgi:hypothetical protein